MSTSLLEEDQTDLYRPANATSFQRTSGARQCSQHMRTRLRLFVGEVFRDIRIGVQFQEIVIRPGIQPEAVANHIASIALDTPGVVDFQMNYEYEPVRGVIHIDADAVYSVDDQRVRVPQHENFQITLGGSIQT